MQLDAALRSFISCCEGEIYYSLNVIYKSDSDVFNRGYEVICREGNVNLIKEYDFRSELLGLIRSFNYVLFMVDDCIFVRNFRIKDCIDDLEEDSSCLGVSLRLGSNTSYCYTLNKDQRVPKFEKKRGGILKYSWVNSDYDFGYPLEVSSSIYRTKDILPILEKLSFSNPNTLEDLMSRCAPLFRDVRPNLCCYTKSIAFCAPLNRVQDQYKNRHANDEDLSPEYLGWLFNLGKRIDIDSYREFTPNGCHQEIDLVIK